jgi:predicted deacylase
MQPIIATLREGTITLPYEEIIGDYPGPTVTITAGMDGDEYAGIEAAHTLIDTLRYVQLHGKIRILPVINVFGNIRQTSYSPIDNKYPKRVFPGSARGTHTEQFMHWLYKTQIQDSDLWIDLHGGATDEILTPFMWLYQSKHQRIQQFQKHVIENTSTPIVVYDRNPFMSYSPFLDMQHIAHIIFECGDQGKKRKSDIERHSAWTIEVLSSLGVVTIPALSHTLPKLFTSVQFVYTPHDPQQGQLLWKHTEKPVKNGEICAAYAYP